MKENTESSPQERRLSFRENVWPKNFKEGHETPTTPSTTILFEDFKRTLTAGSRIIDIACGFGAKIAECADVTREIGGVGIDINEKEIEWANKNWAIKGVEFVKMDATNIRFPDNSFTHAVASGIFGAVDSEIRKKIIAEAFRVLKPGGILVSTDFKFDSSDSARVKYEADKLIIENVLHQKAELGDRIVYDQSHDLLFIVTHLKEEEERKLYLGAGFELLALREDFIETAGFEDRKVTMRLQHMVLGRKPHQAIG